MTRERSESWVKTTMSVFPSGGLQGGGRKEAKLGGSPDPLGAPHRRCRKTRSSEGQKRINQKCAVRSFKVSKGQLHHAATIIGKGRLYRPDATPPLSGRSRDDLKRTRGGGRKRAPGKGKTMAPLDPLVRSMAIDENRHSSCSVLIVPAGGSR